MPQLTQLCPPLRASLRACSLIAVLAVFGALLSFGASADIVDKPAPDFALRSMKGPSVRLSEHLGEVVVINFWATWCGPCRQEMPLLDVLYGKYRQAGLILLSVNIDENVEPAIEMAQTLKVSYPVLFDSRKEVSRAYDVSAMPVTVLVDRAGVVRYVAEGYKPGYEKRYTDKLRELLNE
jgi:thiol-disulfide isomerase/thioredoxin